MMFRFFSLPVAHFLPQKTQMLYVPIRVFNKYMATSTIFTINPSRDEAVVNVYVNVVFLHTQNDLFHRQYSAHGGNLAGLGD